MTCVYPCPLGEWPFIVTCPERKSTCLELPARTFIQPCFPSPHKKKNSRQFTADFIAMYSYFEKGCRKKCTRQSRKVLWVILRSLFFKESQNRMAWEAMDLCLQVLKESNKSRFDSYKVRNSVLIISHITFRDCRVHIFSDNLSRNSCIHPDFQTWFDGHDSTCHDSTLITWRIA